MFLYDRFQIDTPYNCFTTFVLDNIVTSIIKGTNVENQIDVNKKDQQVIYAPNGLTFSKVNIMESLESEVVRPCEFQDIVSTMSGLKTQKWKKMEILGDAYIYDSESSLFRVFEKTVKSNEENDIIAPVRKNYI